jgi:hypothetical protein
VILLYAFINPSSMLNWHNYCSTHRNHWKQWTPLKEQRSFYLDTMDQTLKHYKNLTKCEESFWIILSKL